MVCVALSPKSCHPSESMRLNRQLLTSAPENIQTYICAGLLKHSAFAVWSLDKDLMIESATLRLAAEEAIKEAFDFNGTLTDAQTQWIACEQARCISVATEYPELLEESSCANISMLKAIKTREVRSRHFESRLRINALQWLISSLCYSYIDLTVYARRSDQLNTVGERFRVTHGQLQEKQYLLEYLQRMLSKECGTGFEANEQLFADVEARADDPGPFTNLDEFYDDLLAGLEENFVPLDDLGVSDSESEKCVESDWTGRPRREILIVLLRNRRRDCDMLSAPSPTAPLESSRKREREGLEDALPEESKRVKTDHVT